MRLPIDAVKRRGPREDLEMNDDPPGPPVLQRTAPAGRRILVSDFDGTITDNDFYQLIARQYMPRDAPAYFEEFRQIVLPTSRPCAPICRMRRKTPTSLSD
jgi:hypothetical protein